MKNLGVFTEIITIMCDNTSSMNMAKNPVQHKRTKQIDVRHHFLRDNVKKMNVLMRFGSTEDQLADIFTKSLGKESFLKNRLRLGMVKLA